MKTQKNKLENTQNYRKSKKGVITNIYAHQLSRSRERWLDYPEYSLRELQDVYLNDIKFNRIYNEWIKSGYTKEMKPSIDRINNKKWYSLDNIQILTWKDNRYKQSMERRCRNWRVIWIWYWEINTYKSQREAVKITWISQANISSVLNWNRKTAWGYKWIYENPDLLNNK